MSRLLCNSISTGHLQRLQILVWLLALVLFVTSLANVIHGLRTGVRSPYDGTIEILT